MSTTFDQVTSLPVNSPTPGRGRPGYSKEDVIRIAVQAFNEHGYEATSMGALAKKLQISKSAIYHHVSSKEEILEYAINQALTGLDQALEKATEHTSPLEQLRAIIRQAILVLCTYPEQVTLLLRLRGNSELEMEALCRRREYTQALTSIVSRAQQVGELDTSLNPSVLGRLIFGMINSITEWYSDSGELAANEMATMIERLIFHGLPAR